LIATNEDIDNREIDDELQQFPQNLENFGPLTTLAHSLVVSRLPTQNQHYACSVD